MASDNMTTGSQPQPTCLIIDPIQNVIPELIKPVTDENNNDVNALFNKAIKANYLIADTREITIEETDMLFIDSLHTYDQLKKELGLHGNKAKKYLVFHDTFTYGLKGEIAGTVGLLPAIIEFIIENPCWFFKIHKINNNGLIVLERKPSLK